MIKIIPNSNTFTDDIFFDRVAQRSHNTCDSASIARALKSVPFVVGNIVVSDLTMVI